MCVLNSLDNSVHCLSQNSSPTPPRSIHRRRDMLSRYVRISVCACVRVCVCLADCLCIRKSKTRIFPFPLPSSIFTSHTQLQQLKDRHAQLSLELDKLRHEHDTVSPSLPFCALCVCLSVCVCLCVKCVWGVTCSCTHTQYSGAHLCDSHMFVFRQSIRSQRSDLNWKRQFVA